MEEILNNIPIEFTNEMWAIITPLILIILDVLTGVVKAWKNDDFQSTKMRAGLGKKFGEIVYVIIGVLTKFALNTNIIEYFLTGYICIMEIASLLENCDELGVPIPEKLKEKINNIDTKSGDR